MADLVLSTNMSWATDNFDDDAAVRRVDWRDTGVKAAVNWLFVMVTVTTERNESRSSFMDVVLYFCFCVDVATISYALQIQFFLDFVSTLEHA